MSKKKKKANQKKASNVQSNQRQKSNSVPDVDIFETDMSDKFLPDDFIFDENLSDNKPLKRRKRRIWKLIIVPVVIAACVITAGYFAGVAYYKTHFFKGTDIYGTDVSLMKIDDFKDGLTDYKLEIVQKGPDGVEFSEEITADELGITVASTNELADIMDNQNAWEWPFKHSAVYAGSPTFIGYDSDKILKVVKGLRNMKKKETIKSENAYISEYKEGIGYEIVDAVWGNELDEDATVAAIEDAVVKLKDKVSCEDYECYKKPDIMADDEDLNNLLDKMNKYVSTEITYQFGDDTKVLNGNKINKWISVKKGKIKLNEDKISEFVDNLRRKYDTIFRSRTFKTSYGKTITIDGGDYGWWMNTQQEKKDLKKLIKKGKKCKRVPAYYQTAESYGKNDYGDTYVEVNLTAQHVILYKNGKMIMEADCVSGNSSRGYDTPAGVYGITYKQRDATLNGENYSTPVSYWMPFNKNIGLHDAGWRSSFGGDIYKTSGSHGCVNLPPDFASKLYEYVDKGTPVICYNLEGTKSGDIKKEKKNEKKS